jgi:hypothetical protein
MYRGRKGRCLQPLAVFCSLASANLGVSPTAVKQMCSAVHASDQSHNRNTRYDNDLVQLRNLSIT